MGKAGKMKKKGTTGEVVQYITRNRAVRRLQVTLPDFRKLCILKGIYPREPKHRQKVQKGSNEIKTLYYKKDIAFLLHEPIIWTIRDQKIHSRKRRRCLAKNGQLAAKEFDKNRPFYKVDHLVRERYPNFVDALADLDDALSMCYLFSTMAKNVRVQAEMIGICKRLTVEFLHYVIEAKALRKAFISIKGYYYEAEINGQPITWIVPHNYAPQPPSDVDMRIMVVFVEFYLTMLGFVNYRLYQNLNLYYPPKLDNTSKGGIVTEEDTETDLVTINERIEALNKPLMRSFVDEEDDDDETLDEKLVDGTDLEALRKENDTLKRLKSLFSGMKFYLGRETNRESMTFVIRSFSGEVSWDKTIFQGATYGEDDQTITHQIVDRPNEEKKYLSRYYVQPQWIYDCVNARLLLPVQDYFPGVELPPHLSPFVTDQVYQPPEKKKLIALQKGEPLEEEEEEEEESEEDEEDDKDEEDEEEDDDDEEEETKEELENEKEELKKEETQAMEVEGEDERLKKMVVRKGRPLRKNPIKEQQTEEMLDLRMRAFMVPKKHRRTYRKLRKREGQYEKKKKRLTNKRQEYEQKKKDEKKNKDAK